MSQPQRSDGVADPRVRIETGKDYFKKGPEKHRPFPGVQVVASVLTGHRTVWGYLPELHLGALGRALE